MLTQRGGAEQTTAAVRRLFTCAAAYELLNWHFVVGCFACAYIGCKMFAIPVTFTLSILAGAIYPLPFALLLTGVCEAVGSSCCYLLSATLLQPLVRRLFAEKLEMMRTRAAAEREHMLLFNFFLRLTPMLPNWFINLASPIVGVPLLPFFVASLFGTQLSLLFLTYTGRTLRELNFIEGSMKDFMVKGTQLGIVMAVLQTIPIGIIYLLKRSKRSEAPGEAASAVVPAPRSSKPARSSSPAKPAAKAAKAPVRATKAAKTPTRAAKVARSPARTGSPARSTRSRRKLE